MRRKKLFGLLCVLLLLLLTAVALSGCGKDKIKSVYKPTNVSYDGARITWDRVDLADYYTVSINGGEEKRVNTNLYSFENKDGVEFDVTVYAVIKGKSFGEDAHFVPLDTITSFTVSDSGVLSWDEVPGATAYRVTLNGTVLATDLSEPRFEASEGNNRVKVRAVVTGDNGYYSLWSEEKQIYVNSAPTSIDYDGEKLSWLGNGMTYEVTVNGTKTTVNGTTMRFDSERRDFSVEVKSVGDHATSFDSKTVEETFHYLQPVTDMVMEDGILNWTPVANAEGYDVRINGAIVRQPVTTAYYDSLAAGTTLAVEVRPFNKSGKYFSIWSDVKSVYILESPVTSWNADLELDGEANNNFIWDSVNGAVGYTVEVEKDGVVTRTNFPIAQRAFAYAYAETGSYSVRVKAVADVGSDYYDSRYSTETVVERLAAPKLSGNSPITSDPTDLAKGFTVNYTAVSGASGYQLYKDGVLLDGKYSTVLSITDGNVADDSISAAQEYTYSIRSMGSVRNASGKTFVTLPCLSRDALSFRITVQAMPAGLTMSGFEAQWSAVSGNNGYGVKYSGSTFTASATNYNLSTLKPGTYDVSVCTRGNGGTTLASNYTAAIVVQRLPAPTNIKISYGTGEGQLGFSNVANAKSYQVFLDESTQALPENAFDNMYQYIRESGTVLHMVAVANYYNDLGTVYYMTSESSSTQQFIRLSVPTFPEGAFSNSTELVWNAPGNINTLEYTPTYEVYESGVMQTGGVQNGTRFNVRHLEGGKSYTFRIKAIGNDSKYLDSDLSVAVTVYKLAAPTMTIKNGQYTWQGVTNASGYVLEIDGVRVNNDIHVSGSEYSYTPHYTEIGSHNVRLYAVGDGYNNINSDSFTYVQTVRACLAPEISFGYSSDTFVNGGTITVTIDTPSANCSNYQYEIAGESIVSDRLTESKPIENTGTYYVRVKALGGTFDANEVYYIDSQYAGGNSGYSIKLLAPPTLSSFSINSDGATKWATITDAYGYDYQIAFDDGEYSAVQHTGTASLNPIANLLSYKTIRIKVKACGNGSSVISSEWVEYTWSNPNK
ncbi:MAG: hypothetical protein J6Z13_08255 [Clostridia bacterium]|nr:hypothetical protein [Clostridia bacterium]